MILVIVGCGLYKEGQSHAALPGAPVVSQAICDPNPPYRSACTTPGDVPQQIRVDDGSGQQAVNRPYYLDRPGGLLMNRPNGSKNLAPLVLLFSGGGGAPDWQRLAAQDHFVLALMNNLGPGYFLPTMLVPNAIHITSCGPPSGYPSGNLPCDDIPAVVAIVKHLIATQNVDPSRVYAVGGSKGGAMTYDTMCDPRSSSLFAGFGPMSSGSALASWGPASATGPARGTHPNCPALGWNGTRPNTTPTHTTFRLQVMEATDDLTLGSNGVCERNGCVNHKGTWSYSGIQVATQVANPPLGCSNSAVTTYLPSAPLWKLFTFSCPNQASQVQVVLVTGNHHSYDGLDGVDGVASSAAVQWNFLAGTHSSAVTAQQIRALLSKTLVPRGKPARIRALLKHGGYPLRVSGTGQGRLLVSWSSIPTGTRRSSGQATSVLIAAGRAQISGVGNTAMMIKLTKHGRRLLAGSQRLKLTAKATLTPTLGSLVVATNTITIRI